MTSIGIFDVVEGVYEGELKVDHRESTQRINHFDEKIETYVMKNETSPSGYTNFRIINDEVYNQTVRVKGETVDQVIRKEVHEAYFKNNPTDNVGHLITLCRKDDSEKVRLKFEELYDLKFQRHQFDILNIIREATDVRSAKFDVSIETVSGVTMRGTGVHNTQYYASMISSGELKAVIVSFDMPEQSVTFRISVDGSILLYNQLSDYQVLDLVRDLLNISMA
ncbi:hypothetical protein AJGP001_10670 [Planococcus faecalis]|uniref:Uncharacterized protein n=1 Tax=Planococcus faecalis TaxID=1598147 RepID=A0ABM6IWV7_9BACL|nr:hypothetical protein AJGP001_10670 [Planococcus faecalis]OHX55299.1 hypothetical protein BB777_04335 [Planococcus faecalis]